MVDMSKGTNIQRNVGKGDLLLSTKEKAEECQRTKCEKYVLRPYVTSGTRGCDRRAEMLDAIVGFQRGDHRRVHRW